MWIYSSKTDRFTTFVADVVAVLHHCVLSVELSLRFSVLMPDLCRDVEHLLRISSWLHALVCLLRWLVLAFFHDLVFKRGVFSDDRVCQLKLWWVRRAGVRVLRPGSRWRHHQVLFACRLFFALFHGCIFLLGVGSASWARWLESVWVIRAGELMFFSLQLTAVWAKVLWVPALSVTSYWFYMKRRELNHQKTKTKSSEDEDSIGLTCRCCA